MRMNLTRDDIKTLVEISNMLTEMGIIIDSIRIYEDVILGDRMRKYEITPSAKSKSIFKAVNITFYS